MNFDNQKNLDVRNLSSTKLLELLKEHEQQTVTVQSLARDELKRRNHYPYNNQTQQQQASQLSLC